MTIQNPSFTDKYWNPVPGIRNPWRGIQNPTDCPEFPQGHPTTIYVNYMFGEPNIAQNFLLLEEARKFLDDLSIDVNFRTI